MMQLLDLFEEQSCVVFAQVGLGATPTSQLRMALILSAVAHKSIFCTHLA